uniref:Beta-mannosidase n=1 Tax=Sphaeramia orbicularis TaxID=375764 RepID=A0A673CDJ6_9TELE
MALNSRTPAGFVLCLCLGLFCAFSAHSVSLDGKWSLRNSDGSVAGSGSVPGCVHSALQQLGYIQDPYFRFNDVAYRWIAFDNWTYTTTFNTSEQLRSKQKVVLVLDGVDTVASVQLNGFTLGGTDNMFRSYAFSVRPLLKEAENVLSISLASPVLYASQRRKAHSAYPVPPECPPDVQNGQCHVNFIRKEQSSFSWDWGPSFPTLGLWRGVHLEAFDVLQLIQVSSVPLFGTSSITTSHVHIRLLDGLVSVSIPELFSDQTYQSGAVGGSTPVHSQGPFGLGGFFILCSFFVHGGFYTLWSLYLVQVYFRTVELVQEPVPGSPGLSFFFRINSKPVFLKGSNWIPAHAFQDQVTPDILLNLLHSAADANMNALRVWGGGVYEQDQFYDLCDHMGIMVWQDFMFACAMYPTEADFIQTVRSEVIQQVQRLKSHPSIIIWSGNNENEAALATNWFDIPESHRATYVKDYVTLYVENIRALVQQEDPSRPFLVSSPTNGAESEREGWVASNPYDPHFGDTHFYSYEDDCWDWSTFPRTRFASEFGFQSWPSFSTLKTVSVDDDWSYDSNFSSHRQHHEHGNQQMLRQAALHFHLPNSTDALKRFTHTLYMTQVMQAQCVKAQTEFYRRSQTEIIDGKGRTMGALYWQLNDIWPAPSWSSIEFGGKWKMLHYFAQDFFAAVLPVGFEDDGTLLIYAVSDLSPDLTLRAVVRVQLSTKPATTSESLAVVVLKQEVAALLAGCGRCTRLSCLLTFHLEDGTGVQRGPSNYHFLCSPKDAEGLRKANITAKVQEDESGFSVTLRSDAVAPFVWLDVGNIAGRFSSNGFLMVSADRTVGFTPWRPTSVSQLSTSLSVTSLRDVY